MGADGIETSWHYAGGCGNGTVAVQGEEIAWDENEDATSEARHPRDQFSFIAQVGRRSMH
jgi:hypothetical protein